MKQAWQRAWWQVCVVVTVLTAAACWWQWTWRLDQAVYDAAQSTWTQPSAQDVVIVAIDEPSLQAMGRWPWKRAVHAQALALIKQAQPKAVLLDLLLSEPEADPRQDALLAQAMRDIGKVVLPVSQALDGLGHDRELRPIPPLEQAAMLAHSDAALDADGTLRRAYLWAGGAAHRYPHPALALLQAAGEAPQALSALPADTSPDANSPSWHRQSPIAIPYLGPPGHVQQVSYAALLRGEVPPAMFKGRYVLIGATAQGLGETFQTPVSPGGQGMSGIEVIGQLLQALRQDRHISALPAAWHAALSALIVLGLLQTFPRLTPRQAFLSAAAMAFASVVLSWALMAKSLWWPPFGLAMGALLSYPIWSWRRLEATAQDLEAELHKLSADPGVQNRLGSSHDRKAPGDFMSQRTDALSQATLQLRQARQLLAHTLAMLPEALFVVDHEQVITQVNQQACTMTGFHQTSSLLGQRFDEVLASWSPSDAPSWGLLLAQARQRPQVVSTEATHPRGKQYLVNMISIDKASPQADVIVCAADVSALRQAELQRAELLGFIAHDIRSPQASLISLVELHRIGGHLPQDEMLSHVDSMARHTLELCEELLQVMRAETRPLTPQAGDLIKLAQGCLGEMQVLAQAKHITLVGEWAIDASAPATFDDYLLHRALNNLLGNAIKFSPEAGRVSVSVTRQGGHHVVAVKDQGPGIPESELGRLFKRYERVEQGRPSKLAAGIGLGLVFIDTVARRHGGEVKVINRPGEGACFELWLPTDVVSS